MAILEKGIELWIVANVCRTGISAPWLVDKVGVKGIWMKRYKAFLRNT
jgi:hypothetical protein